MNHQRHPKDGMQGKKKKNRASQGTFEVMQICISETKIATGSTDLTVNFYTCT